jgi:hypothetical protein
LHWGAAKAAGMPRLLLKIVDQEYRIVEARNRPPAMPSGGQSLQTSSRLSMAQTIRLKGDIEMRSNNVYPRDIA